MVNSQRRRRSDWATYKRLFTYLHGYRTIGILLFACILCEAFFTITTISTLKPVLDLVDNRPIVETGDEDAGIGLDVSDRKQFPDGTLALRFWGDLTGHEAGKKLRGAVRSMLEKQRPLSVVDLTSVRKLDNQAWSFVYLLKADTAATSGSLSILLPPGEARRDEPADAPRFKVLPAFSPEAAQLRTRYPVEDKYAATAGKSSISASTATLKKRLSAAAAPYAKRMQDYAAESQDNKVRVLAMIMAFMVFSAIMTALAGFGVGYLSNFLATAVVKRLRNHIFEHMLWLDLSYFSARTPGSLMSHVMQDVKAVDGAVDLFFSNVLKTPITVLTLISMMLFISPSLTLYTFIVVPALAGLLYKVGRRIRKASGNVQRMLGLLSSILEESINGIRVVKAFNMEKREAERFEAQNERIFRTQLRTNAAEELGSSITQIIGILMVAAILLLGGKYIVAGQLRSSEFVLFVGFLVRLFQPLKGMSKVTSRLQRGFAGSDRVFRVLDDRPEITDQPGAVPAPRMRSGIEFRNVTFQYTADRGAVLRNINLRIEAGRAIALVGETGSGKSTFVNLLPRFYDPTEGSIIFEGVDLRDIQVKSLRDQMAIVTQDPVLFNDTVAKNIAYGRSSEGTPDKSRIEAAAKAAKLHDFIVDQLPEGYDTTIGSRGTLLSGGQKQRLAIARAIYRDAPILILDEATSSLDSETESLIQEALNNLMQNRTTVVVAHRLSTIQNCDEIYVMDKGRFVEHGTHEELLRKNGRYARFHEIQFGRDVA